MSTAADDGHFRGTWAALARLRQQFAQAQGWAPLERTSGAAADDRGNELTQLEQRFLAYDRDPPAAVRVRDEIQAIEEIGVLTRLWYEAHQIACPANTRCLDLLDQQIMRDHQASALLPTYIRQTAGLEADPEAAKATLLLLRSLAYRSRLALVDLRGLIGTSPLWPIPSYAQVEHALRTLCDDYFAFFARQRGSVASALHVFSVLTSLQNNFKLCLNGPDVFGCVSFKPTHSTLT